MQKISLFFCLLVGACSSKNALPSFDLSDLSKINLKHTIPLDSIVVHTELIPLDNEQAPLVGIVTGICESDDYYFVVSGKKNIYQYNKQGKFIRQIGAHGRGPGEHLFIEQISFDAARNTLYMFDYMGGQLLKYDSTGKYLSSFRPHYKDSLSPMLNSFFMYKDTLIFTTFNNSVHPDLFVYKSDSDELIVISQRERNMGSNELLLVNSFPFGSREEPMVYVYFSNTVFTIRHLKLIPTFLILTGKIYAFHELSQGIMSQGCTQVLGIVKGGDWLFVHYNNSSISGKPAWKRLLALCNTKTFQYTPHVAVTDSKNPYLSITSDSQLFQGHNPNTLIMVQTPEKIVKAGKGGNMKEDDNPVIIKYWLK